MKSEPWAAAFSCATPAYPSPAMKACSCSHLRGAAAWSGAGGQADTQAGEAVGLRTVTAACCMWRRRALRASRTRPPSKHALQADHCTTQPGSQRSAPVHRHLLQRQHVGAKGLQLGAQPRPAVVGVQPLGKHVGQPPRVGVAADRTRSQGRRGGGGMGEGAERGSGRVGRRWQRGSARLAAALQASAGWRAAHRSHRMLYDTSDSSSGPAGSGLPRGSRRAECERWCARRRPLLPRRHHVSVKPSAAAPSAAATPLCIVGGLPLSSCRCGWAGAVQSGLAERAHNKGASTPPLHAPSWPVCARSS